jgi:hypothetical protein
LEGDGVAEAFELGDEPLGDAFWSARRVVPTVPLLLSPVAIA